MTTPGSNALRWAYVLGVLAVLAAGSSAAEVVERIVRVAGTAVHYKVVFPNDYDSGKAYPAILIMGGGPQTMNTVEGTLERNFRAQAERRGYLVFGPAAPDGELFFQGGERIFPEFLEAMVATYEIVDGKFHIAGPSNGGIAALHVAAAHPDYFLSVTAFPGYLWRPTEAKLLALAKLCVFMYIGENDEYRWHDEMRREAELLRDRGTVARFVVEQGQAHRLESLAGANASRLFDGFEATKQGCAL
jgi:predicted esterase